MRTARRSVPTKNLRKVGRDRRARRMHAWPCVQGAERGLPSMIADGKNLRKVGRDRRARRMHAWPCVQGAERGLPSMIADGRSVPTNLRDPSLLAAHSLFI
jgi:hypothetical protein